MKVGAVFHRGAVCADPQDSMIAAAQAMRRAGSSCLAVFAHGAMVGIVTERDLADFVAAGAPKDARVVDFMNQKPVTVGPDDDIATAVTRMLMLDCRHLPVMEAGHVVGMVSARDLLLMAATPPPLERVG